MSKRKNEAENTEQQEVVTRTAGTKDERTQIKFSEINTAEYCHRDDENLHNESEITDLMNSIISEGLHKPLTVAWGKTLEGTEGYILVSGHRRHAAIKQAIEQGAGGGAYTKDSFIPVAWSKPETGRTPQQFEHDLLLRSISENRYKSFSTDEVWKLIAKLVNAKIPAARASRELGIARTTYDRRAVVVKYEDVWAYVTAGVFKPTKIAELVEHVEAEKNSDKKQKLLAALLAGLEAEKKHAEKEVTRVETEALESGKEASKSDKKVSTHVRSEMLDQYKRELAKGITELTLELIEHKLKVKIEDGKLVYPTKKTVSELSLKELRSLVTSFEDVSIELWPEIERLEAKESAKDASVAEQQRKATQAKLAAIRQRERDSSKGQQPTNSAGSTNPAPSDISKEVQGTKG